MLFRKKRWLCKEVENMLLALHPVFHISVKMMVSGDPVFFSFRDENGNMIVDPYERKVVGLNVDYMRNGCSVETFYVGKDGLDRWRVPYIRERLDQYVARFPKTNWNTSLKQLGAMREELRTAICNSMNLNILRNKYDNSPSITIAFSELSPEEKRRVCDVICNLDSDAVYVQLDFSLDFMNAEQICTTLDQLALYDAGKEAECGEEGEEEYG